MKKFFVVLALAGMVGSVSAATFTTVNGKTGIVSVAGDKNKDKKKEKKKKEKSCCTKDGAKGGCCKDKEKAKEGTANPQ